MRLLGIFLSACVILAALKAAIIALAVLFVVSLLWGFYLHPREATAFLIYCALLGLVGAHPTGTLFVIGAAILVGQFGRADQSDH